MKNLLFTFLFLSIYCYSQQSAKPTALCAPAFDFDYLDINNIKTPIYASGEMHWNMFSNGLPAYEFPKGTGLVASGASGLWIGGLTSGGQLKIAAQTYRQSGLDFWTGPLNTTDASVTQAQCSAYDKIWKVSYSDINDFITNYNRGYVQANLYTPAYNLLSWPAFDTLTNVPQKLAPFVDVNGDGKYNPQRDGDYPDIKGDQSLYYIFNDNGNIHSNTGGQYIGVQVNAMAYAYGCPQVVSGREELLNTTFYHFKLYNRSNNSLTQAYIGIWVDANIGNWQDDFVGSNPKKGYAFGYNGSANDSIYTDVLPATGTVILKAPKAIPGDGVDNDNNGNIDELNEELLIPNIYYYNHLPLYSGQPTGDPSNAVQFYQYLQGKWRDGTPITCGGNGYGGTTPTKHVFPGSNQTNSVCPSTWTEKNVSNPPGNRCYLLSMGPFNFNAHDSAEVEFAFVTSVDIDSMGTNAGIIKLENDIAKVKNFYNMSSKPNCIGTINIGVHELIKNSISVFPNPSSNLVKFISPYFKDSKSAVTISDLMGRNLGEFYLSQESNTIDISLLSKGIYFAAIQINNQTCTYKIIKQ